jgi:hypothetical protein
MPGKYSHGLVLAQYSSKGIISLPNDEYLKSLGQPRASSAAALRQRAASNATKSSGPRSIAARSATSLPVCQKPRVCGVTPSRPASSQNRVVIMESDSEREGDPEESEEEQWVRPWTRPPPRALRTTRPRASAGVSSQVTPGAALARAQKTSTKLAPARTTERFIDKKNEEERITDPSNRLKKRGGVNALMRARYQAEMKKAAEAGSEDIEEDAVLSLRDILQTKPKPDHSKETPLTMREFLICEPDPHGVKQQPASSAQTGQDMDSAGSSSTQPRVDLKSSRAVHQSAYRMQNSSNAVQIASSSQPIPLKQYQTEPDFDCFAGPNEKAQFVVQPKPAQQTRPTTSWKDAQQSEPERTGPHTVEHSVSATTVSTLSVSEPDSGTMTDCRGSRTLVSRAKKKSGSHKRQDSSLSSMDSDLSSIFGMSSVGATTMTTSGYSPATRLANKTTSKQAWHLPHAQQNQDGDNFADMFHDINNTTTIFTSDEEEGEQDDEVDKEPDLPPPRVQSIPESELFPGRQWGIISAGQNIRDRAREDDEMSDMSAVFPPDIGRSTHGGAREGSLPMAIAGKADEGSKAQRARGSTGKLKKQKRDTGQQLLQKLRKSVR